MFGLKRAKNKDSVSGLFKTKTRRVLWWPYKILVLLILCLGIIAAAKPLAIAMARALYLPRHTGRADALIIETGGTVSTFLINQAMAAFQAGQVEQIIITRGQYQGAPEIFALANYDALLRAGLDSLGIPSTAVRLAPIHIQPPYTHNTARALLPILQAANIDTVLLMNDNFHIRRSVLAYRHVFAESEIAVFPYTVEIYLDAKNWWQYADGWRRVFGEYIKLIFYRINGYL